MLNRQVVPKLIFLAALAIGVLSPGGAAAAKTPDASATTSSLEAKVKSQVVFTAREQTLAAAEVSSGPRATVSRRRNRRVSIARAQRNAKSVAREYFLDDVPAFDYGTGQNSNCDRRSRSAVVCLGWVDTYADEDVSQEFPLTCWFSVRTTGGRRAFRLSYVEDSAYCEAREDTGGETDDESDDEL